MQKSLWNESTVLRNRSSLNGDVKTDVLIIGGGLCGILCAYYLHNSGIDYLLLEGGKIASGVTKNTILRKIL